MFHPKQSFRASSARWSHGFYQVRSPRQWTSSRFLPSFVAVEQATPDLQSKAIFFCRWSGCTLTLGDTQFLDNMSAWLLYLSWVCSVEGAIYIYAYACVICIYPKWMPISTRDRMPTFGRTHILGHWRCRFECLSEETCLPFPACANKALVVGACHCFFSLIISARNPKQCALRNRRRMGTGEREDKRSVHTAGWWCVNRMSASQDLYHRISEQDLCSLHQVSVQNLHKRSPSKISVQDLWEVSWQDLCTSSLQDLCRSSRNAHEHVTRAILCGNLRTRPRLNIGP